MTVSTVSAATRLSSATTDAHSTPASARTGASAAPAPSSDDAFKVKAPPRFPWLTRLADELESHATQKPSFPSAPVLGDNLDKSA